MGRVGFCFYDPGRASAYTDPREPDARFGSARRRQDVAVQDDQRHQGLLWAAVEAGVDDGDEVECRDDVDALAAVADRGAPVDLSPVDEGAAQPEGS